MLHVMPKLKGLFDEFLFSQNKNTYPIKLIGIMSESKVNVGEEDSIGSRSNLVLVFITFQSTFFVKDV